MSWLSVARKSLVAALDAAGKITAEASELSEQSRALFASLSQQLEVLESALRLAESSSKEAVASETGNDHQSRLTIDG